VLRSLLVVSLLSCAACSSNVDGELYIGPRDGSAQVFTPSECTSGEPLEFFGVDILDNHDRLLRFVHFAATGPELIFFDRGDNEESLRVHPSNCRLFDGRLKRTDVEINGVWAMKGDIALDCDASNGDVVQGEIEFSDCADINNNYDDYDYD